MNFTKANSRNWPRAVFYENEKTKVRLAFIYPMFVFAGHTGARRAQILRSKITDIDFVGNMVTIHERKKSHERITTRRVPMSPVLRETLKKKRSMSSRRRANFLPASFFDSWSFDASRGAFPSPSTRPTITSSEHSKKLSGASSNGFMFSAIHSARIAQLRGINQRLINGWVGHVSEDMVRRYQHLIPDQQQRTIEAVFS